MGMDEDEKERESETESELWRGGNRSLYGGPTRYLVTRPVSMHGRVLYGR